MRGDWSNHVSRRRVLGTMAAGLAVGGCSGNACGQSGSDKQGSNAPAPDRTPHDFREAPALREKVDAGALPHLKERLPQEPYVVRPGALISEDVLRPKIGTYGGTLQMAQLGPDGDPIIFMGLIEPLIWAPGGMNYDAGIKGNVLTDWKANEDNTVFTFTLRKGLRWSDGKPVTLDDVEFAFNDVLFNEEITPISPAYLHVRSDPEAPVAKLKAVDDRTFTLTFAGSYGSFPSQIAIAGWASYADLIKPRHYLEQFHKKYADPDEFAALLEKESVPPEQWFNLFNDKQMTSSIAGMTGGQIVGHPSLSPWVLKSADGGVFTYERNPYYFKVDPEGNQLPYIDEIRAQVVQNEETLTSRALFGEFDYLGERATFRKLPVMADKADEGKIKLLIPRQHVLPTQIFLNLTHTDKVWRQVTGDLRVRRALSLAMNRKEMIENFYLGEFASIPKHTNPGAYDPKQAKRLLDEAGLDKLDAEGYRLGPDGKRFRIPFEVAALSENHIPVAELVSEYWKDVGVYTTVHKVESARWSERQEDNDLKAMVLWLSYPLWKAAAADDYLPANNWGPLWSQWHLSNGKEGEKPPKKVRELFGLHSRFMAATIGSQEYLDAYKRIVRSQRDNIWSLSVCENAYWPTFFSKRVENVPTGTKVDEFGIMITAGMEQWYLSGKGQGAD